MGKKYNHAFDLAFELESDNKSDDVTATELLAALEKRVEYLKSHPDEIVGACGLFDTIENEEDEGETNGHHP